MQDGLQGKPAPGARAAVKEGCCARKSHLLTKWCSSLLAVFVISEASGYCRLQIHRGRRWNVFVHTEGATECCRVLSFQMSCFTLRYLYF